VQKFLQNKSLILSTPYTAGSFITSCFQHCAFAKEGWNSIHAEGGTVSEVRNAVPISQRKNNVTMQQAATAWWEDERPESEYSADDHTYMPCALDPTATAFNGNCNPTCPLADGQASSASAGHTEIQIWHIGVFIFVVFGA
jgi:hypothetical protein